ncbi:MAG: hypothetical protein JXB23_06980 [Candidatus Aminicenantes bacterium]|nr:hypothetical protein [Candidatus Aminicenantes bacterium]
MVFEQVLIFGIGVAIFAASFALFIMYQNHYTQTSSQNQLTGVKEYVLSSIIRICEKEDVNTSVILNVPRTIGNNYYKISLSPEGLNLTIEGIASDYSPLYNLNGRFDFSGMAISDLGKIVIYRMGNEVSIDRQP